MVGVLSYYTMPWYRDAARYVSDMVTGRRQKENTQQSVAYQISYNDYLVRSNARAYRDWQKNVGRYGRKIKYPGLSYPGQIYKANTATARAMLDADTASANYYGNLPFRLAGVYGITSRLSRWI